MQNPPPGQQQQGYGSPYGTPPNSPMMQPPGGGDTGPKGKTALGGLDANLASALGYPIVIIAIIMMVTEKQNRFARFNAMQALLLYGTMIVIYIGLLILAVIFAMMSSTLGTLIGLVIMLFGLGCFGAVIFCAYKAYQGEWFKLPAIGNIAENFAKK
ncbi:MAG TPA: DUF4870 domain-containing protein [Pyrinomonadaceae bacterium]|jgi:uncharacterized membrane protein